MLGARLIRKRDKMEIDLGDFNMTISDNTLSLKHPISGSFVGTGPTLDIEGKWVHLLLKYKGTGSQGTVTMFRKWRSTSYRTNQ